MKRWMAGTTAALLLGAALCSGVQAQTKPADCGPASPAKIEGEVTKVDAQTNTITVKASDGTTHEFHSSKEDHYTVGDKIEARLRASNCF